MNFCLSVCYSIYTNPQFTSDDREILHTGVVNAGRDNQELPESKLITVKF
jgi:hypothetical protein